MAAIKVTAQNRADLAAGKDTVVSANGKQYLVGLGLIYYALDQWQAGGDIDILAPTWVAGKLGPMEELVIKR